MFCLMFCIHVYASFSSQNNEMIQFSPRKIIQVSFPFCIYRFILRKKWYRMKDREEKSWERRSQVVNDKGVNSGQGHGKAEHISRLWGFKERKSSHFDDALWEHWSYTLGLWLVDGLLLVALGPFHLYIFFSFMRFPTTHFQQTSRGLYPVNARAYRNQPETLVTLALAPGTTQPLK